MGWRTPLLVQWTLTFCSLFAFGKSVLQKFPSKQNVWSVDVPFYPLGCATIPVGFVKVSKLRPKLRRRMREQLRYSNAFGSQSACQILPCEFWNSVRRTIPDCLGSHTTNRGRHRARRGPARIPHDWVPAGPSGLLTKPTSVPRGHSSVSGFSLESFFSLESLFSFESFFSVGFLGRAGFFGPSPGAFFLAVALGPARGHLPSGQALGPRPDPRRDIIGPFELRDMGERPNCGPPRPRM